MMNNFKTLNQLRNVWFYESGEKAYTGVLPKIVYKRQYVEWLEELALSLNKELTNQPLCIKDTSNPFECGGKDVTYNKLMKKASELRNLHNED